jgi:molybdopterin-guanine dinucleotide biosynthesis protein A
MWGALILAGGRSRRMKGNKALINLRGKPLLLHATERIRGLTQETVVVVGKNDDLADYKSFLPPSVTILRDTVTGMGPLVGILTGIQTMSSEYVVVLPCDSPFIKKEVLTYLFKMAQGADAAIPRWPNGNIEPLQAVYRVSATIPAAETALERRELFILDMIKRLDRVIYVGTEEIRKIDEELMTFFNINTQEDLIIAEKLFSKMF